MERLIHHVSDPVSKAYRIKVSMRSFNLWDLVSRRPDRNFKIYVPGRTSATRLQESEERTCN